MVFKKMATKNQDKKEDLEFRDQCFFHDIINQTHGMLLFLTHKEVKKEGLSASELNLISKEIKTMQSLIKDHYQFSHKNLIETYSWVGIDVLESSLKSLFHNYLGSADVELVKSFKADFSEDSFVHFPTFYRVVNNVIKNISEAHVESVFIKLELTKEGLTFETVNSITKNLHLNEARKLEEIILSDYHTPMNDSKAQKTLKNIGLDSIATLCHEALGEFEFHIEDRKWINRVKLPTKKRFTQLSQSKKAA